MAGSHRRTLLRASLIATLVLGMSGLTAGSAFAAVTSSVTDGVLSITVGGGDAVTVECETKLADTVLVNLADPDTGPADCDSITSLRMVGDATASVIDLAGVTAGDFPSLDETRVNAGGGGDTFFGSPLTDRYVGGPGGPELIRTGGGNDLITGGGDVDDINGGGGFDTLHEHADADFTLTNTSLTGVGEDRLASIERAKLYAGVHPPEPRAEARTSLLGELFANSLDASAFSGPVLLSGGAGDDVLVGGSGDDRLRGSSGNDALTGGPGDDYLRAGNGDDTLDLTDSTQANDYGQGDRGFDTCSTDTGDLVWSCEILTLAAFT